MGTLFYVIGASGVGKNSLMDYARKHLHKEDKTLFVHRYITRPVEKGGENHVYLTKEEFTLRKEGGLFLFNWESHGLQYGLGVEIKFFLSKGFNVVMNGSRGYLSTATKILPDLVPVLITASQEVLRKRLRTRGRETSEEIEERLKRAAEYNLEGNGLRTIKNNFDLEYAGNLLIGLITGKADDFNPNFG